MPSVLILEDDHELSMGWWDYLTEHGFDVDLCATSRQAIQLAKRRRFDVMIVDLVLKSTNTTERDSGQLLLNNLLLQSSLTAQKPQTPVLGVTAMAPNGKTRAVEQLFAAYGVRSVLFKPFTTRELLDRVNALLRDETDQVRNAARA